MREIVDEEYERFLRDIAKVDFIEGVYVDEIEYEGDYSHNEIDEAQQIFEEKVREYLHENHSGDYVLFTGYNVMIVKVEEARNRSQYSVAFRIGLKENIVY